MGAGYSLLVNCYEIEALMAVRVGQLAYKIDAMAGAMGVEHIAAVAAVAVVVVVGRVAAAHHFDSNCAEVGDYHLTGVTSCLNFDMYVDKTLLYAGTIIATRGVIFYIYFFDVLFYFQVVLIFDMFG